MGKKTLRKKKVSKGLRPAISDSVVLDREPFDKAMDKLDAWRKGKNPWVVVDGPTPKHRFMKKRANDVWGNPKTVFFNTQTQPLPSRRK